MLKALVVKATINFIVKWRVYFAGELLATFENEQDAKDYANFIDQQDNNWIHFWVVVGESPKRWASVWCVHDINTDGHRTTSHPVRTICKPNKLQWRIQQSERNIWVNDTH